MLLPVVSHHRVLLSQRAEATGSGHVFELLRTQLALLKDIVSARQIIHCDTTGSAARRMRPRLDSGVGVGDITG